MTATDQAAAEQPDEQAKAEPTLRSRLEAVLPPWTHWTGQLFLPGFTATWTMPGGTWTIKTGMGDWPRLTGPGGWWNFGRKDDADHVIGVLRALDAIEGGPDRPCDVLCRDVEADRNRLAAQVAAAYAFADELAGYCSPHGVAHTYAQRLREALDRAGGAPAADPAA